MTFTNREIDIYIRALKDARRIAIETGKGLTVSNALTRQIQTLTLQRGVALHKGTI